MHASMAPELLAAATRLTVTDRRDGHAHGRKDVWLAGQDDYIGSSRPFQVGFVSSLFGDQVRVVSLPESSICATFPDLADASL